MVERNARGWVIQALGDQTTGFNVHFRLFLEGLEGTPEAVASVGRETEDQPSIADGIDFSRNSRNFIAANLDPDEMESAGIGGRLSLAVFVSGSINQNRQGPSIFSGNVEITMVFVQRYWLREVREVEAIFDAAGYAVRKALASAQEYVDLSTTWNLSFESEREAALFTTGEPDHVQVMIVRVTMEGDEE